MVYSRIGKYIHLIDNRNTDLTVSRLVGLTGEKKFIPSVANIIGTDLSKYKVIRYKQFACSLMQVSRDGKMPVAMFQDDEAIMSPAYPMFEVNDECELMPEYLMMYLSRSEFDREVVFYAVGGVRGSLEWNDFLNIAIPVPPIEEQHRIVSEYQTIERRIKNNEAMIQKLEETAQAIYHHTFVENIDENNLPEGWRKGCIRDLSVDIVCGKTPSTDIAEYWGDYMPFLTIPDMHDKVYALTTERSLSKDGVNTQSNKTLPIDSVCVSCIGTAGLVCITTSLCQTNQQINTIIPKDGFLYYSYFVCSSLSTIIKEYGAGGAVLSNLSKSQFENIKIYLPEVVLVKKFNTKVNPLFRLIKLKQRELIHLHKLLSLLTSKLTNQ